MEAEGDTDTAAATATVRGCGTALVTPFRDDGALDEPCLRRLVRRQIDAGIHFLVPCGTTGEGVTLTAAETLRVVEIAVEEADGAAQVVAGCGGNDTRAVARLAASLSRTGADALLTVTPYYNKPTPDGLALHYRAVAEAAEIPVYVYNVPSRTGLNTTPATLARLAEIPGVAGVKEASGDIAQIARVCRDVPAGFAVLSGDDSSALATIAMGGSGLISVVSNQIPGPMADLCNLCLSGDFPAARAVQNRWLALMDLNFCESNPGPVKFAMAEMGLLNELVRPPLAPVTAQSRRLLRDELRKLGLLGPGAAS